MKFYSIAIIATLAFTAPEISAMRAADLSAHNAAHPEGGIPFEFQFYGATVTEDKDADGNPVVNVFTPDGGMLTVGKNQLLQVRGENLTIDGDAPLNNQFTVHEIDAFTAVWELSDAKNDLAPNVLQRACSAIEFQLGRVAPMAFLPNVQHMVPRLTEAKFWAAEARKMVSALGGGGKDTDKPVIGISETPWDVSMYPNTSNANANAPPAAEPPVHPAHEQGTFTAPIPTQDEFDRRKETAPTKEVSSAETSSPAPVETAPTPVPTGPTEAGPTETTETPATE